MARRRIPRKEPTVITPMQTGLHPVRPTARTHRKMVRTELPRERRKHKK